MRTRSLATCRRILWGLTDAESHGPSGSGLRRLRFEPLEDRRMLDGSLVISEFMAINNNTLNDKDGDDSDWIEIHNPTFATVNLDGWSLTDNAAELAKWQFPAVALGSGDYLVVFASGKDLADPQGQLHTNFKLDGDGEYLALVKPDATTVAHEYTPAYPQQFEDVSYGMSQELATFLVPELAAVTHLVPTVAQANVATAWTELGYDDSSWNTFSQTSRVLVTEARTSSPDYVEIQNVSNGTVDTTGWTVVANDTSDFDINAWHSVFWQLPGAISPGETLYRTSDREDIAHYWGQDALDKDFGWLTQGPGWVLILDGDGSVVDFVVWGYSDPTMAGFDIEVNGNRITAADVWNGSAQPAAGNRDNSLQRHGGSDHDNAADWAFLEPPSINTPNAGLLTPFATDVATGIGFDASATGIGAGVQIDVQAAMYQQNGSLWARVPFAVEDPLALDAMQLRMKYNDGFVAYINGVKVAENYAPASPAWNSPATHDREVPESLEYELFDVSMFLDVLQPGVNVLAIHGLNFAADDPDFLILPDLASNSRRYFGNPTPGAANTTGFIDYVKDTKFSVDRGFFDAPLDVAITSNTPGATIIYTLDGSEPTETHGTEYTGPIHVTATTTLRAVATKENMKPTDVDTQTYIFPDDVIQQSVISSTIRNHPTWGPQLRQSLLAVPTISLVTPGSISLTEKPTSIEMLFPDGSEGFQEDAGVEHFGGHSLGYAKKSMRVSFKSIYGSERLDFGLFGEDGADQFDQFLLRSGSHDTMFYINGGEQGAGGLYLRNRWISNVQLEMGQPAPRGRFVHVYVNGTYWGQHHLMERPNAAFMASYFGGDKEDYDALNGSSTAVAVDGDWSAFNAMVGVTGNYDSLQQYMDVVNYADYMVLQFYGGNDWDWNTYQNWMAARERKPGAGYKFFAWDSDMIFRRGLNANVINRGGPGNMWATIKQHEEFKILLADRAQRYFFNDGLLTPDRVSEDFRGLATLIQSSIIAETARWGRSGAYGSSPGYTPATWQGNLDTMLAGIIAGRTDVVVQQMRSASVFPSINAPDFSINGTAQHGGQINVADALRIGNPNGSGTIYYTLDGSDPRLPGGGVNTASAVAVSGAVSGAVPLEHSTPVLARVKSTSGEWSALGEAAYHTSVPPTLAITEINYHPQEPSPDEVAAGFTDGELFEFIELQNVGDAAVSLMTVHFADGVELNFTGSNVTSLAPGEHVVVAKDRDAFEFRYGTGVNVAGYFTGSLENAGERIQLAYGENTTFADFTYNDAGSWPGRADGKGATLELIDPDAVPHDDPARSEHLGNGENWHSSVRYGGTPGGDGDAAVGIVINEVLSHTDWPGSDSVELVNTAAEPIDLFGWYLSDDWGWDATFATGNYKRFRIPEKVLGSGEYILGPGEYVVFDESHFNPTPLAPLPQHFSFNAA
ncbi:MAG: lamin tail domain-containing protein, partial [Candidatus Nealsonbacteria bacterium]|nr:lamin tail domain-containing protein [Candidatus Nealsonbacteria bacterium]